MNRLDRKDVKDTAFDVVLRGYDKRQVDERFRALAAELATAHEALAAATQRAAMLEDAQSEARSGGEPPGDSNFGARVEKILILAQEEAREVRSQAEAAAAALRQSVAAEVDQIRQAVAAEADELFSTTAADADRGNKKARAEADHLVVQARAEAERLVAAATDAALQRERSSAHELHQLSRLHDEINADLYRAKEVLDGLFGANGATPGVIWPKRRKDSVQPAQPARTV